MTGQAARPWQDFAQRVLGLRHPPEIYQCGGYEVLGAMLIFGDHLATPLVRGMPEMKWSERTESTCIGTNVSPKHGLIEPLQNVLPARHETYTKPDLDAACRLRRWCHARVLNCG